jgi:integrase
VTPPSLAKSLTDPAPARAASWVEHLKVRILPDWRPSEFDFERLLLLPDAQNPLTAVSQCVRVGCTVLLRCAQFCPACRKEHVRSGSTLDLPQWAAIAGPPQRFTPRTGCSVTGCLRTHGSHGLCNTHDTRYVSSPAFASGLTVEQWIIDTNPGPLSAKQRCAVCPRDSGAATGLCGNHDANFKRWVKAGALEGRPATLEIWATSQVEPFLDRTTQATYGPACATPFGLLPEPLRWELLYVVQQRDLTGRTHLTAFDVRSAYLVHRRSMTETVVGAQYFGMTPGSSNNKGVFRDWQRRLDAAHREWSGIDERDPKLIYIRDLSLRKTNRAVGPEATLDLRGISRDWIVDSIKSWTDAAVRGYDEVIQMAWAWQVADETLSLRATPDSALGRADMDAVVIALTQRYPTAHNQRAMIRSIRRLVDYGRSTDDLQHHWAGISARFAVDSGRHRANGAPSRAAGNADEPFRFVPQPIVDHVMDHLHLIERATPYLTAEARAMLFVHERCGRRSGETIRLLDDCISYDNQGAPYLEWRSGKPPYTMGKRLPIHQETHDVIREWQDIKRERGIESKWLFPSQRYSTLDSPWRGTYLGTRLTELIDAVVERAPYEAAVEGPEGNLAYFDLRTIDPYAFRHAFAQRFADATDADGRSTTPPDVLQEYMGHASYNTTMGYYQVTAKRRKKALEAVAPRRLNLRGLVVPVDRERDGFTKVAVTLGHCTEPQNVAAGGHGCMVDHACESCPFFLVDPLEREGMDAKRHSIQVKLERARVINAQQHLLDHYEARIQDCTRIIDGIDAYIDDLSDDERYAIRGALEQMADIRRRATAPRVIDLRQLLTQGA